MQPAMAASRVNHVPASAGSDQPSGLAVGSPEEESWHSFVWQHSRSGARASRGFHFQEAVGAWLASQIASGELVADRLTPEGFDDLQLEGNEAVQIEVKSRQERLGPFRMREAAGHIAKALSKHDKRFGTSRRLVIVLEQGMAGWGTSPECPANEIRLPQLMEAMEDFDRVLTEVASARGLSLVDIAELVADTTLMSCSWESLIRETERQIGRVVSLPPAALAVVRRHLWSRVADAVDKNAEVQLEERDSLTRADLIDLINSVAQLLDLGTIEYSLAEGICNLVDTTPDEIGDSYYEGVSTQPGHVSAGFVVPRPELISQVTDELAARRAVLLTGPSGVGKSAALWTLPSAFPGVLWFRVNRIFDEDVPHIIRLLTAYSGSSNAAIGLLVDALNNNEMAGWSRLRQAVAALPNVHLVASARKEDLFSLGNMADCTMIPVSLDEEAARTIHAGLVRRGATTMPHWLEAFEQSNGLTLEFTHLLTQGARLNDVVADQIADRIRDNRDVELRVLALVSTAGRWSVSIPYQELESHVGADPATLRAAFERLADEHLLIERDGMVTGIHPVRSKSITEAVHGLPPPELKTTVAAVLSMLRGSALSRFLYEVLRDEPDLEEPMLETLKELAANDMERVLACLQGLALLDFHRRASAWIQIAERHGLPPTQIPFALELAVAGLGSPQALPEYFRQAVAEMIALPEQAATADVFVGMVGTNVFQEALLAANDAETCRKLLEAASRTNVDWTPLLSAVAPSSPLVALLTHCPPADLAACISVAREVSVELARVLVNACGGADTAIARIHDSDPWLRELYVDSVEDKMTGVARFIYLSEAEQGDPRERAVEIGKLLLRCLPDLDRTDVKAVLPGDRSLVVGGIEHGVSKLTRSNDHTPDAVGWNQFRIRLTRTLFGASETERLHEFAPMLADLVRLVLDFGNAWARQSGDPDEVPDLWDRRSALYAKGLLLPPKLGSSPFDESGLQQLVDPLASLITEVCDKVLPRIDQPNQRPAVTAYITETVLGKLVPQARRQPWRLIGLEDAPSAFDELESALGDIVAVLTQFSADRDSIRNIVGTAQQGPASSALVRAAKRSRSKTDRRERERRARLDAALRSAGMAADVYWADGDLSKAGASNFAVAIHVAALHEWEGTLTQFIPIIEEFRAVGEHPIIVPIINGKSVPPLAKQLVVGLWPAYDLGEFKDHFPHQLEQRLTDPVLAAHAAVQVLSGLASMGREGQSAGDLEEFAQRTRDDFRQAVASILDLEQDAVTEALIEWLEEISEQIEDEFEGNVEAGTFATNVLEGTFGECSHEWDRLAAAVLLSLQWDFDPASAVALLEQLDQTPEVECGEP